jgi:hypothetical protein
MRTDGIYRKHLVVILNSIVVGTSLGLMLSLVINESYHPTNLGQSNFFSLVLQFLLGVILFIFIAFISTPFPFIFLIAYVLFTDTIVRSPIIYSALVPILALSLFPSVDYYLFFRERMTFIEYIHLDLFSMTYVEIVCCGICIGIVYCLNLERLTR